ncbi:MAG: cobalamin B12-binding domain-containing protein, partial [Pseudomonadota bacterium]
ALRRALIPGLSKEACLRWARHGAFGEFEGSSLNQGHILKFTHQLIALPQEELQTQFLKLMGQGHSIDTLFRTLFVQSAYLLGEMWAEDACSFGDVTLGLTHIHQLLHRYSENLAVELEAVEGEPAILITPMPGENHIFAASLLSAYFRAAHWRVHSGIQLSQAEILQDLKDTYVDAVALTIGAERNLGAAKALVGHMKAKSRNQDISILVGGRPLLANPALVQELGADGTAGSPLSALDMARQLISSRRNEID